jgi:cytochrome P450
MAVAEPAHPVLAGLEPPPRRAPWPSLGGGTGNRFADIPAPAYEQPIWRHGLLRRRAWVVSDPAAIRRVLVDNAANYPKTPLERRFFRALFGEGLLSSDGETWRAHRKIMAPAFDPRSVTAYAPVMAEAAEAFARGWDRLPDGAEIDVSQEMIGLTLEIISRALFSADAGEMTGLTGLALRRGQEAALAFGVLDLLPVIGPRRLAAKERRMAEIFAPMDGAVNRLVEARRADPGRTDLLGRLVAALDQDTGAGLAAGEVRDEVLTLFVAGHETTASAMTFVWYLLSRHPEHEARLHAELDAVLDGRTPGQADLPNLGFTRRVIEEAMRLYPPAPGLSVRVAEAADEIGGRRIERGALIVISPWVLHRHRRLWENPERFDPDRFLPERSQGRPRFAYLPFGGGPRVCIGQLLAMTEATLILACLAQRFRLRPKPGHEPKLITRVTLRPRDGLPMLLQRRVKPESKTPRGIPGAFS